jgi:hypothetical protein
MWAPNTATNRLRVLFAEARTVRGTGLDDPQLGRRSDSSSAYVRTVHAWGLGRSAMAQMVVFFAADLDLVSREDSIGEERS